MEQYPEHYTTYQVYIIPGYECKVLKKEQQKALLSSTIPVIVIEILPYTAAVSSSNLGLSQAVGRNPKNVLSRRSAPEGELP